MLQHIDVIPWFDFIIDVSAADSLDVSAAADSVVVKAPAQKIQNIKEVVLALLCMYSFMRNA